MRRLALACALALALAGGASAATAEVELEGTWHVLVHYTDSATSKPEQPRWEDRIWVFERQGEKLRWSEYPIVVFEDQTARFERLGTNRASRVLHHWEPNERQLGEIRSGLQVNQRGSKNKTLRAGDDVLWTSDRPGRGGYQSARFLTYTESWRIEGDAGLPIFVRDDSLGSAGTESVEGRTRYATQAVEAGGDVLSGSYERDGTRRGSFRMTRSGSTQRLRGKQKSEGERVTEMFFGEMATQLLHGELAPETGEPELRRMIEAGEVPEPVREDVRARIQAAIEQQYEAQGNDPRAFAPQIQSLARQIERAYLDEGRSLDEIRQDLGSGRMRP